MRRWAIYLALTLPACTTTIEESEQRKDTIIDFEVDCKEGARVRFGGSRDESGTASGEAKELDPSKLKGIKQ